MASSLLSTDFLISETVDPIVDMTPEVLQDHHPTLYTSIATPWHYAEPYREVSERLAAAALGAMLVPKRAKLGTITEYLGEDGGPRQAGMRLKRYFAARMGGASKLAGRAGKPLAARPVRFHTRKCARLLPTPGSSAGPSARSEIGLTELYRSCNSNGAEMPQHAVPGNSAALLRARRSSEVQVAVSDQSEKEFGT